MAVSVPDALDGVENLRRVATAEGSGAVVSRARLSGCLAATYPGTNCRADDVLELFDGRPQPGYTGLETW
jgi:hypothetical protein